MIKYIAGFFDGEGTVAIYRQNTRQSDNSYFMYVSISQKRSREALPVLQFLLLNFGGSVYYTKNKSGTTMWKWQVGRDSAVPFLEAIYPHLIIKKKQVRIALYWQANKISLKCGPTKRRKTAEEKEFILRTKRVVKYLKELKRSS